MLPPNRYVEMVQKGSTPEEGDYSLELALNPRPERCGHCSFPDIDAIPAPYRLPIAPPPRCEAWPAALGGLFLKERARAILEVAAPGQFRLHPTFLPQNGRRSDWWLATPLMCVPEARIDPSVPRCPACREPKVAHREKHFAYFAREACALDVFNGREWRSAAVVAEESPTGVRSLFSRPDEPPASPNRWTRIRLERSLYFSMRLELLFRHLCVVGIGRSPGETDRPAPSDWRWAVERMEMLKGMGLGLPTAAASPSGASLDPIHDAEDVPTPAPAASHAPIRTGTASMQTPAVAGW